MKAKYKLIVFLIIMTISLFIPIDTFAAKKSLGTCNYSIDVNKLGIGRLKKLNLKVTVYEDGSTGSRKISGTTSSGKKFSETPEAGLLLGDSDIYLQYSKMFNKNGNFYKKYKESNNCPDMQFIYYVNTNQLHFNVDGNRDAGNNSSFIAKTESTGGTSSTKPSSKKTYCNRTKPVRSNVNDMTFTTTETGNIKQYTITIGSQTLTAAYNGIVTFDNGYSFRINPDDYDVFWSDKCNDSPLYLNAANGYNNMTVQTTKPEDVNNGSYGAAEAGDDYGFEYLGQRENNATSANWNKEIECSDIFKTNEVGSVGWMLNTVLNYIKVIGPILVVLLSAIDFIKAIFGFDEKAMTNAYHKLIIRLIAAIALFLVPTLIQVLLSFINATTCTL